MAATRANEISKYSYFYHGGFLNSSLARLDHQKGNSRWTTYHHIGIGQMYWKQDKKV